MSLYVATQREEIERARAERAQERYAAAREVVASERHKALAVAHQRPVARCSVHRRQGWFDCPVCGRMCFLNRQLQCRCGRLAMIRDRLEARRFLRACEIAPGLYRVEIDPEAELPLLTGSTQDQHDALTRGVPRDDSWRVWPRLDRRKERVA